MSADVVPRSLFVEADFFGRLSLKAIKAFKSSKIRCAHKAQNVSPGEPQTNDRCNRVRHASHGFYQNMIINTKKNAQETKSNKLQVQRDMHLTTHNTTNINQLEFPLKIFEQFQRWRRVRPNLPTGENSHCR